MKPPQPTTTAFYMTRPERFIMGRSSANHTIHEFRMKQARDAYASGVPLPKESMNFVRAGAGATQDANIYERNSSGYLAPSGRYTGEDQKGAQQRLDLIASADEARRQMSLNRQGSQLNAGASPTYARRRRTKTLASLRY